MRLGLFWRTFLLIAGLITVSVVAAVRISIAFAPAPPEQKLAWEIASVVNLTRAALVNSQGERRRRLLDALARDEGVRVAPLEPADSTAPLPDGTGESRRLREELRLLLGARTQVAGRVNGEAGLWVSFFIDGDAYWLGLNLERLHRQFGPPWWLVGGLTLLAALVGAILISRLVNRPLAGLASAIGQLSQGDPSANLPEEGPSEIAELNRRFNRLASDLAALESDRALGLAGISHDIRTPLTRLRMEIELSALDESTRQAMVTDIERIDAIVGKFIEYARAGSSEPGPNHRAEDLDVALLVGTLARDAGRERAQEGDRIECDLPEGLRWTGERLALARIVTNLIENALKHGRSPDQALRIEVSAWRAGDFLHLKVRDHGPGVPTSEHARLLRPFARMDAARGDAGGSGLGLAIVARLAARCHGHCTLRSPESGGLEIEVSLRDSGESTRG